MTLPLPSSNFSLTALDQALLSNSTLSVGGSTSLVAYRSVSLSYSHVYTSTRTCHQDVSPGGVLDPVV